MKNVNRPAIALIAVVLAACGGGEPDLPPAAAKGRQVAIDGGCTACHGADGQGGVGPAWAGLMGSQVELEGGSTVVADIEYLRRSISDPQADIVAGYTTRMPDNTLSDAQVDSIIAYIDHLGSGE